MSNDDRERFLMRCRSVPEERKLANLFGIDIKAMDAEMLEAALRFVGYRGLGG